MISYALTREADLVVIPLSDWLHKGHEARINTPGTVGAPNWMYRMSSLAPFAAKTAYMRKELERAGRINTEE